MYTAAYYVNARNLNNQISVCERLRLEDYAQHLEDVLKDRR